MSVDEALHAVARVRHAERLVLRVAIGIIQALDTEATARVAPRLPVSSAVGVIHARHSATVREKLTRLGRVTVKRCQAFDTRLRRDIAVRHILIAIAALSTRDRCARVCTERRAVVVVRRSACARFVWLRQEHQRLSPAGYPKRQNRQGIQCTSHAIGFLFVIHPKRPRETEQDCASGARAGEVRAGGVPCFVCKANRRPVSPDLRGLFLSHQDRDLLVPKLVKGIPAAAEGGGGTLV